MLRPLSAAIGAIYTLALPSSAVSSEANALQQSAVQVVHSIERSEALFGAKAVAITALWSMANECANANWDGNGANPVENAAVFNAIAFIRALPGRMVLPEFAPDPDGSISLDWIVSRTRVFSISVSARDRLAYAWLDGSDRGHAVATFDRSMIPQRILDGIDEIVAHGIETLWSV